MISGGRSLKVEWVGSETGNRVTSDQRMKLPLEKGRAMVQLVIGSARVLLE